ncbi:transcriptional regulator [Carnobacterium maltaromaticum]|uniref:transcriptional regulator n=1 Tax=Carnobacterium maltaromaticum TaxID=2751 RepID=UPI0012F767BE|nr:transcriptional regulator [Carnobacterium maltaromaticum]
MYLFDIKEYEMPTYDKVEWAKTKHQVGIFLSAYKISRERNGFSSLPKLTAEYTLMTIEANEIQSSQKIAYQDFYKKEYVHLHRLFVLGYSSIVHPYRPEVTERRRKVFMLRYLYGLNVSTISERIHYQKNIVVDDSKKTMLQFSRSLNLLELKK